MDGDETGVDCGGQCAACNVVTPTCTPQANSINIGTLYNSATGTSATQGSDYVMQGNYSGGYFTITLGGSNLPNQSIAYSIINSSFLYSNEASVNLNDFGTYGSMDLSSGSLYISMVSGKYTVTICNGSAHSWITSQNYAITGKISFP